jgi:hypothetical protein
MSCCRYQLCVGDSASALAMPGLQRASCKPILCLTCLYGSDAAGCVARVWALGVTQQPRLGAVSAALQYTGGWGAVCNDARCKAIVQRKACIAVGACGTILDLTNCCWVLLAAPHHCLRSHHAHMLHLIPRHLHLMQHLQLTRKLQTPSLHVRWTCPCTIARPAPPVPSSCSPS